MMYATPACAAAAVAGERAVVKIKGRAVLRTKSHISREPQMTPPSLGTALLSVVMTIATS